MAIAPRVTKLYLRDVQGVDALALRSMMDGGMVEIIVNVQEAAEWGDTLGRFFRQARAGLRRLARLDA